MLRSTAFIVPPEHQTTAKAAAPLKAPMAITGNVSRRLRKQIQEKISAASTETGPGSAIDCEAAWSIDAAAAYGLSDFVGGVVSKRVSPWAVALAAQLGGAAVILALALGVDGDPTARDLWWGAAAGLGNGVGTAFLYRGLSSGRMGVVAHDRAQGCGRGKKREEDERDRADRPSMPGHL